MVHHLVHHNCPASFSPVPLRPHTQDVEILSVTTVNSIRTALYCQELVGIDLVHMIEGIPDNYRGIVLCVPSVKLNIFFPIRKWQVELYLLSTAYDRVVCIFVPLNPDKVRDYFRRMEVVTVCLEVHNLVRHSDRDVATHNSEEQKKIRNLVQIVHIAVAQILFVERTLTDISSCWAFILG